MEAFNINKIQGFLEKDRVQEFSKIFSWMIAKGLRSLCSYCLVWYHMDCAKTSCKHSIFTSQSSTTYFFYFNTRCWCLTKPQPPSTSRPTTWSSPPLGTNSFFSLFVVRFFFVLSIFVFSIFYLVTIFSSVVLHTS